MKRIILYILVGIAITVMEDPIPNGSPDLEAIQLKAINKVFANIIK